jgi:hypothetical protein
MKITKLRFYGGARSKVSRLGLSELFLEIQEVILDTEVYLEESKETNGAAVIRELLDERFRANGWKQQKSGGIDWQKTTQYGGVVHTRLGLEIQVSARSDLLVRDVIHLRNSLQDAGIDVGVIVVPSDRLATFLPSRTPRYSDAEAYIEHEFVEAMKYQIAVIAIEHDGPGPPLKKKTRRA